MCRRKTESRLPETGLPTTTKITMVQLTSMHETPHVGAKSHATGPEPYTVLPDHD